MRFSLYQVEVMVSSASALDALLSDSDRKQALSTGRSTFTSYGMLWDSPRNDGLKVATATVKVLGKAGFDDVCNLWEEKQSVSFEVVLMDSMMVLII